MGSAFVAGAAFGIATTWWTATAMANDRFVAFNLTTTTDFKELYLAPAGTHDWGANQVLNDKDKVWDASERLRLTDISRGQFDVRLVDSKGRQCSMSGVDMTKDLSFDVRDANLASCR